MSEMIVKLNSDRVKLNGCEYVQDLTRCEECIRWTHHGGWTMGECERWREQTDGTDFCSYAERKDDK